MPARWPAFDCPVGGVQKRAQHDAPCALARETPRPMAVDDLDNDVNEDEEDDEQVET